jgi:hypothetical protein
MLETIAIILAVIALAIAAVLAYAATRPGSFRIERSTRIAAPPGPIYRLIEDFRKWTLWSPFETIDPDMKRFYSGAESGKGAAYAFDGNNRVGAGRLEIVEADRPARLRISLDFERPCEGHNVAEFTLEPSGGQTLVTWAMHGQMSYKAKVFTLFCSMEKMVGGQFEKGLATLKAEAESEPRPVRMAEAV